MLFYKMQSLGNDFVIFGSPARSSLPSKSLIQHLCDRHYGVGADCAIFIGASKQHDYFMHVYNPDGFEAEMCGNALRCSARYVTDRGYFAKRALTAETNSGIRNVSLQNHNVCAEIGKATILNNGILNIADVNLHYSYVSMGNPHCVVFLTDLTDEEFNIFGPAIETHSDFPNGTNVEFASINDDNNITMRVWERGIGETFSCVTGSCACVAAAIECGHCNRNVAVHQIGGTVNVETRECGNMFVTGECLTVFKGELLQNFREC